jgi:hypothetical protein
MKLKFILALTACALTVLAADKDGFKSVFNGKDFEGWAGPVENYEVVDGAIQCKKGKGGTIHTKEEYGDFVVRLEFKVPAGGNNGLAIRYPGKGDTAYVGMCELQVLDAKRGAQKPVGEWNQQEVTVKGSTIKVVLNGQVILDADLSKEDPEKFMGKSKHPGLALTKGFFGFAGHGDAVAFRNISIKRLD